MNESFRTRLLRGDLLIGTVITLPSPEVSEIFSQSGSDYLFVDLEHSAMSLKDAQHILQVAAPQTPGVIRVPSVDEAWMKKILDIGPAGVIIPQIRTAHEAISAVQLCKYPPDGLRGVGIARAHSYGEKFQEYVFSANEDLAIIVQIEHIDAVTHIEEIIQVPGIDCLYIGPYDLSASMGKIGRTTDPDVQSAISKVKQCADQAKIPLGVFGTTVDAVRPYIQSGYSLITVGMDAMLLASVAKSIIENLK